MNSSIFKISLDIHKPESQVLLDMKRRDSSRAIHISLTENGRPYQITPDCSAVFTARKPDGNPIYNDCRIDGNVIIYDVTQQTVSCIGEVDCEIRLFNSDGGLITSPRFGIVVDYTIYNGEEIVESAPEFDALQDRIDKADELYNTVKSAYENGELNGKDGEKGDKGDKGEKGDSGSGLTEEQAADLEANTKARHTHNNGSVLDSLTPEWINSLSRDITNLKKDSLTREEFGEFNIDMDNRISLNTALAETALKLYDSNPTTQSLHPSVYYNFGEIENLTLDFTTDDSLSMYRNEFAFTFISGETPTVLTLPSSVQWANELTVEANKRYEISIVDNIGLWCAVDYTVATEVSG